MFPVFYFILLAFLFQIKILNSTLLHTDAPLLAVSFAFLLYVMENPPKKEKP